MPRNCNCAGGQCGPQLNDDGVTRREFITLTGIGAATAAGAALAAPAKAARAGKRAAATAAKAGAGEDLQTWMRALHGPAKRRRYTSAEHTDARMPLGGIGTGNFEIGADGQFTTWQLFNTLRDGYVPMFFGVTVGDATDDGRRVTDAGASAGTNRKSKIQNPKSVRLLQTAGGPDGIPRIAAIEMTGDYPIATLRYIDKELPIQLEMSAFSPFAPLDVRVSSMPLACFVFRVHNPTDRPQTVSLAAFMQNPVGYDAMGVPISFNSIGFNSVAHRLEPEHPNFGGNVNEPIKIGDAAGILMRAEPGKEPTLDRPLTIYTNLNVAAMNQPFIDRPANLTLHPVSDLPQHLADDRSPATNDDRAGAVTHHASRIIWFEDADAALDPASLRAARDAVRQGATLVFSGTQQPLLRLYAELTQGKPLDKSKLRPDIVFEDFEHGYDAWAVEGAAFGTGPAHGTLPAQQDVSGFVGHGYASSYVGGDESLGRMVSRPFTIERRYIRFLVGGGNYPETQIRLVVDGKVVRAANGRNAERLLPASWDVHDLAGRQAHIEIVDEAKGGWGHILVDDIEFSDYPGSLESLELLDELLPVTIAPAAANEPPLAHMEFKTGPSIHHMPEGRSIGETVPGGGAVGLTRGAILPATEVELTGARQRAYVRLARLGDAHYDPAGFRQVRYVPRADEAADCRLNPKAPGFGTLALATLGPNGGANESAANWSDAWDWPSGIAAESVREGALRAVGSRDFSRRAMVPTAAGRTVNCTVASTVTVAPGKTVEVPFLLAWHYPNKYNHQGEWMGCQYATLWPDAKAVLAEAVREFPTLRARTERFREVFYDSSLPWWLLDAITSQASTIRHIGVVFRIANGDTYGWEGSNGCCTPTCTHVWGYEQSLARLFPELERDMRRIDFTHQQGPDGGINNRTDIPSPPHPSGEHPFTDGHASCILKAYREGMNHTDAAWLRDRWPHVKAAVEYLIGRDAAGNKGQPCGLLQDDQWNTYDEALHGVTTFIGTYYLAALRAGEDLAHRMGDHEFGNRCRTIFQEGQRRLIQLCWNGEYFHQHLPGYEKMWGEVGPGCMSDQLIGQWWAHQLGLGYLLPPDMVKTALRSVFRYNWKPDLTGWKHEPRAFAGDGDKGLIICTWPKGGRPDHVMLYSDEVWTGIEYQVAAHMVYEGMVDEAYAIVKGLRERYDGRPRRPIPRNPWNEIECGGHYARAMSSWSVLLALSGFEIDGPAGWLRFTPRVTPDAFRSLFTGPEGWGSLRQTRKGATQRNEIAVVEGRLVVSRLHLAPAGSPTRVRVAVAGRSVAAMLKPAMDGIEIALDRQITLAAGQKLVVTLA